MAGTTLSAQPKDVEGWEKIKWGMTVPQAKAAYGRDAHTWREENPSSLPVKVRRFDDQLILHHVMMGSVVMWATIETLVRADEVVEVKLSLEDGSKKSAYDTLGTFLRSQYGPPAEVINDQAGARKSHSTRWRFPSAVIRLYWLEGAQFDGIDDFGATLYVSFTSSSVPELF